MVYKKKSWTQKLYDNKKFPKILKFDPKFPCGKTLEKWGAKPGESVVLAPPLDVDEIMKNVPKGKLITIYEICSQLAKKHKVKFCCSLTTGIFINISAKLPPLSLCIRTAVTNSFKSTLFILLFIFIKASLNGRPRFISSKVFSIPIFSTILLTAFPANFPTKYPSMSTMIAAIKAGIA